MTPPDLERLRGLLAAFEAARELGPMKSFGPFIALADKLIESAPALLSAAEENERLREWQQEQQAFLISAASKFAGSPHDGLLESIDWMKAERDSLRAEVEGLRKALTIAHGHIDMDRLRVSHKNDAAAIDAAILTTKDTNDGR